MKWVRVAAEVNPEVTEISTVALVCEERCLSWIWVMIRMDLAFFRGPSFPFFVSDGSLLSFLECNLE